MQRDNDLTFEDILGSQNFLDSDIHEYVAASVKASDSTDTLANLRFLHIPKLDPGFVAGDVACTITERGQYRGTVDYVAVSYCWDSFDKSSASLSDPVASISVIDQGITRGPRCPAEVLFRAVNFAVAGDVSLFWIDQECIDQTDDVDMQKHLQCMHTIYKQAKFSIGLLSFELTGRVQLENLLKFRKVIDLNEEVFNEGHLLGEFISDVKSIENVTRLLKSLRRDCWFSRTWVLQERFSGYLNMHLLIRVSPKARAILQDCNITDPLWEDFPLHLSHIGYIPAHWSILLKQSSKETAELQVALSALHTVTQSISTVFEQFTLQSLVDIAVGDHTIQDRHLPANYFRLKDNFHHIENCDNRVVSDRVAIFANVAGLDRRIDTTGLSSYSLSLLVILLSNAYFPGILIQQANEIDFSWPFVLDFQPLFLLERASDLRRLVENGHEGLDADLEAIDRVLADVVPVDAWQYSTTEALFADYEEGGRNHGLLPLLANPTGNIKAASIIPMSATIEELFSSIVHQERLRGADLSHAHGSMIVRYAVENGQLPEGSTFLAFCGDHRWTPEFIDKHFVADSFSRV